jgi:hypothetical protein
VAGADPCRVRSAAGDYPHPRLGLPPASRQSSSAPCLNILKLVCWNAVNDYRADLDAFPIHVVQCRAPLSGASGANKTARICFS